MSYIALKRKLSSDPLWLAEPFTRAQAWVDILFHTNFKATHLYIRGIRIEIDRGELVWSQDNMATRWKWGRKKVSAFLSELEQDERITRKRHDRIDVITVCNYKQYQSNGTTDGTTNDTTDGTTNHPHHNKGKKEIKEGFAPPPSVLPEVWEAWIEVRKAKKAKFTERAYGMILKDLASMSVEGYDLNAVISRAVKGGWTSLHPKPEDKAQKKVDPRIKAMRGG